MKRFIIYAILFLIVGELILRFDKAVNLMGDSRVVKITASIEITPEYQLLNSGEFVIDENDFRIMVLGDSYIHGGGIEFKDNFSQNLKRIMNEVEGDFDKCWVLDLSKPDANSLDYHQNYFMFAESFQPDVVILGFNLNDIEGNLEKPEGEQSGLTNQQIELQFDYSKTSGAESKSFLRDVFNTLYKSNLIRYVFKQSHRVLKSWGIVVPNSRLDLTLRKFSEEDETWLKSKVLLSEIIQDLDVKNGQLLLFKQPQVDLIKHPEIFTESNRSIEQFFKSYPSVIYKDAQEDFTGGSSKDYVLSKYDGHPNELAHAKMAESAFEIMKSSREEF